MCLFEDEQRHGRSFVVFRSLPGPEGPGLIAPVSSRRRGVRTGRLASVYLDGREAPVVTVPPADFRPITTFCVSLRFPLTGRAIKQMGARAAQAVFPPVVTASVHDALEERLQMSKAPGSRTVTSRLPRSSLHSITAFEVRVAGAPAGHTIRRPVRILP